jgi:multidrug resistance protein MdtO
MAARSEPVPVAGSQNAIDHFGEWFRSFLKTELSPYPGRAWVVARITIAATIVMLLVMIFRIPGGFLGAIFTFFISRENPTATFRAALRIFAIFSIGAIYTIATLAAMVDDPLTHFLWIVITLFIAFYLIHIMPDYGTAVGFGFQIAGAIPFWDNASITVNDRVEITLWLAFSSCLGAGVAVVVEYVFRRVHPTTDLTEGIEGRLHAVEDVLTHIAQDLPLDGAVEKEISLYTSVGNARMRRLLARSGYSAQFVAQMNAAVSLLGRLVDLAAALRYFRVTQPGPLTDSDRTRCQELARTVAELSQDLVIRKIPRSLDHLLSPAPSRLPFLATMERTIALIPQAFIGVHTMDEIVPAPMDEEIPKARLFVSDVFSNPAHIQFALRGMAAAVMSYVIYNAVDWKGLSTCIPTCIITALSTIGSSRQKQFLRLGGAIVGGVIIGFGAQIFILPYVNSIAGFTLVFVLVTALAAWISTSSPRLSYLGVQLALAFYLINLQEFAFQTSLSIARDRVFGVLLGLMCMWLVFDRLWSRNALDEMVVLFSRNLEMFAQLSEQLLIEDRDQAIKRARQLRDQITAGFQAVTAQADAVLFEFGPERQQKLRIRENVRRWQPSLRTLLLVLVTYAQYRWQRPLKDLPPAIAEAHIAFDKDFAVAMRGLASEVKGKVPEPVPDMHAVAENLQKQIRQYYEDQKLPVSIQGADVIRLVGSLMSILTPLHEDIHETFASEGNPLEGRAPGQQPAEA